MPTSLVEQDSEWVGAGAPQWSLRELLAVPGSGRRLLLAIAAAGLGGLAGLGLTATSLWLISRAAQHPNVQALAIAVVGVRTFALARPMLRYAERLVAHDVALRLLAELRSRVFAAMHPRSPLLAEVGRGDLLRRFIGDIDGAQEALVRTIVPVAGAAITSCGAVVLVGLLEPLAAVVLAAGLLIAVVVVVMAARRQASTGAELVEAAGRRDAEVSGLLDALPELVGYGAATRTVAAIARLDQTLIRTGDRPAAAAAVGVGASGIAQAGTLPAVLAVGAAAVGTGRLAAVQLAVLVAGVLVAFDALSTLPSALTAWSRCRAGLARVANVLAAVPSVPDPAQPAVPSTVPADVVGLDLTVPPATASRPVLRHAQLLVPAGERVVVRGPSGCGKSTLLAAVLRLLPLSGGLLTVGHVPLTDLAAAELPSYVAGSLQGDHVFDTTLRDNLRVARPDAEDGLLEKVAERAGLRDVLAELPARWDTVVGPDGCFLSGGQRQRLLLARALLADPQVLVLDEPTAHLDDATADAVLSDLLAATRDRTVLLSTHRKVPGGLADSVLDIRDGRIVPRTAHGAGSETVKAGHG